MVCLQSAYSRGSPLPEMSIVFVSLASRLQLLERQSVIGPMVVHAVQIGDAPLLRSIRSSFLIQPFDRISSFLTSLTIYWAFHSFFIMTLVNLSNSSFGIRLETKTNTARSWQNFLSFQILLNTTAFSPDPVVLVDFTAFDFTLPRCMRKLKNRQIVDEWANKSHLGVLVAVVPFSCPACFSFLEAV